MKLQTQIPLQKETRNVINYNSNLLLLGSCFSKNIGNKLDYFKFQSNQNPFGILFHPKAIETFITNVINEKIYSEDDLIYKNERWHSFHSHSCLSTADKNEILNNLNSAITSTKKSIQKATHIIITLGTSWVYRYIDTDDIVANCHKIPQKKFIKELLSIDEISKILETIIILIKSINRELNIVFTVSPVRHLKDGFVKNTQSKAHLISGIHKVIDIRKRTHYFPSYEIMMDELRDYRFYAEDMIHPNKTAINYIWEKFVDTWFSEASILIMKEIEIIQKGITHRPFDKNSKEHQKFLENLEQKKSSLQKRLPFIKF